MSRVMRPVAVVDYPYSDGRPMAESEAQLRAMLYLVAALYAHFRDRDDVYVGADMFIYHEQGSRKAVVAPDVFVALGVPKRAGNRRLSYKLWEEPKGPDFVLEVASRSTWAKDRERNRALYARLGVQEYWLYDPTGEHIGSRLRAMRLDSGGYRELAPEAAALEGRHLRSAVLGSTCGWTEPGSCTCGIRGAQRSTSCPTRSTWRGWRRKPGRGARPRPAGGGRGPAPRPRRRLRSSRRSCGSFGVGARVPGTGSGSARVTAAGALRSNPANAAPCVAIRRARSELVHEADLAAGAFVVVDSPGPLHPRGADPRVARALLVRHHELRGEAEQGEVALEDRGGQGAGEVLAQGSVRREGVEAALVVGVPELPLTLTLKPRGRIAESPARIRRLSLRRLTDSGRSRP